MLTLENLNKDIQSLAAEVRAIKEKVDEFVEAGEVRKAETGRIHQAIGELKARVKRQGQKRTLVIKQTWAMLILQVVVIVILLVK